MNGVLNIDKPAGMTSHDVVARIRRLAHTRHVGHAGTLDPDATGVLVVCLGIATRLADLLAEERKTYRATLTLGMTTSTEDAGGQILAETDASHVTQPDLARLLPRFTGEILQTPPMVSAVHHQGRRLHELAREGMTVERAARPVTIEAIEMESFAAGAHPEAVLTVRCGKGTYVRTLCADLGAVLGVGGHMSSLRRLAVGAFTVENALPLDDLTDENLASFLIPPAQAVGFLPARVVSEGEIAGLRNGQDLPALDAQPAGALLRLVDGEGHLLALGRVTSAGAVHPDKVFAPEE